MLLQQEILSLQRLPFRHAGYEGLPGLQFISAPVGDLQPNHTPADVCISPLCPSQTASKKQTEGVLLCRGRLYTGKGKGNGPHPECPDGLGVRATHNPPSSGKGFW